MKLGGRTGPLLQRAPGVHAIAAPQARAQGRRGELFVPPPGSRRVDAREVLAFLQPVLARWGGRAYARLDDEDNVEVCVKLDLLHLDADALHDRLHHWTLTELRRALPAASAFVSFHHALPADPEEESVLDLQEGWLGLEPTLRLETSPEPSRKEAEAFVGMIPRFLQLVDASGRPAGFRRWDVGTQE